MLKNIFLLTSTFFIIQCASLGGTFEKEKVLKIKKVAIIGFTYDAPLETSKHLTSALMGNEKSTGPGLLANSKDEFAEIETPTSAKVFESVSTSLKKNGWIVKSASEIENSSPVKEFYNKSVKVGFLPLASGTARYEKKGIPQYAHISSLVDKKEFQKFAKALGVDAVISVYVRSEASQSIPFVTKINHHAVTLLQVFDPSADQLIMMFSSQGDDVQGHTKTKIGQEFEADIQTGATTSIEKFEVDLKERLQK